MYLPPKHLIIATFFDAVSFILWLARYITSALSLVVTLVYITLVVTQFYVILVVTQRKAARLSRPVDRSFYFSLQKVDIVFE